MGYLPCTGRVFAVKIIDKHKLHGDETAKEAMRVEIAILKLVRHPAVICMEDMFESPSKIYIVMELTKVTSPHAYATLLAKGSASVRRALCSCFMFVVLQGGDLFDKIIEYKYFGEDKVRLIMYRLLSAVKYLHSLGIVHR